MGWLLKVHNMTVAIKIISPGISNTSSSAIFFKADSYSSKNRKLLSTCILAKNYF